MRNYTTIQGDTWDMISFKVYGTEIYMNKLIEANSLYREVVFFNANIEINVPNIDIYETPNLPPWKRV